MKAKDALFQYFVEQELADESSSDEWFRDPWYRVNFGGRKLPVFPLYGIKRGLILHDLHHLLSGYDTTWRGELELAGWELGSGGCGWHLFFWIDRMTFSLLALILTPIAAGRAFMRGTGSRNLYRFDPEELLSREIGELRSYVTV